MVIYHFTLPNLGKAEAIYFEGINGGTKIDAGSIPKQGFEPATYT